MNDLNEKEIEKEKYERNLLNEKSQLTFAQFRRESSSTTQTQNLENEYTSATTKSIIKNKKSNLILSKIFGSNSDHAKSLENISKERPDKENKKKQNVSDFSQNQEKENEKEEPTNTTVSQFDLKNYSKHSSVLDENSKSCGAFNLNLSKTQSQSQSQLNYGINYMFGKKSFKMPNFTKKQKSIKADSSMGREIDNFFKKIMNSEETNEKEEMNNANTYTDFNDFNKTINNKWKMDQTPINTIYNYPSKLISTADGTEVKSIEFSSLGKHLESSTKKGRRRTTKEKEKERERERESSSNKKINSYLGKKQNYEVEMLLNDLAQPKRQYNLKQINEKFQIKSNLTFTPPENHKHNNEEDDEIIGHHTPILEEKIWEKEKENIAINDKTRKNLLQIFQQLNN